MAVIYPVREAQDLRAALERQQKRAATLAAQAHQVINNAKQIIAESRQFLSQHQARSRSNTFRASE